MKTNPVITRLRAMLAISAVLVPAVRGQTPSVSVTERVLTLNSDVIVVPEADGFIGLRLAAASPAVPVEAAPALKAGDSVTPDAIAAAAFLKGSAPAKWETDKLYVFECWSTTCGPCIGEMPHLNELHRKFKDQGLCIYGMNVWDEDKGKVEEFVKKKGDGMSYAVAFVGKDGPFATGWMNAAGVTGIPESFVVKNGKLLFHRHPASLTDEVVTALLAGGEQEAALIAKFAKTPEKSVPLELPRVPDEEVKRLSASATELGKAGKQEEAERQLDAFLKKHDNKTGDMGKLIYSFETMVDYFTAAKDEAGAAKYAEKLAAKYPDAMPMMCEGGVDRLKKWMVEEVKGLRPKK